MALVRCQYCKEKYYETTNAFDPTKQANGAMFQLRDPWREWGWTHFPQQEYIIGGSLECFCSNTYADFDGYVTGEIMEYSDEEREKYEQIMKDRGFSEDKIAYLLGLPKADMTNVEWEEPEKEPEPTDVKVETFNVLDAEKDKVKRRYVKHEVLFINQKASVSGKKGRVTKLLTKNTAMFKPDDGSDEIEINKKHKKVKLLQ